MIHRPLRINDVVDGPEFDKHAATYGDQLRHPARLVFARDPKWFHSRKLELLLQYLAQKQLAPERLEWLDIGCGRGDLLRLGSRHFASARGSDPSAEMLASCVDLNVVQQKGLHQLPLDAASCDVVTISCVLHHATRDIQIALIQEARRVLRPGGVLAIFEHNPFNPVTQWIVRTTPLDADARLIRAGTTKSLLRGNEFQDFTTTYFLFFPERVYRFFSWCEARLGRIPLGGQYAVFARTV